MIKVVIVLTRYCQYNHHFIPNLLFFFKGTNKISRLYCFYWQQCKDSEFWCNIVTSKENSIGYINNIVTYAMAHNCLHILGWKMMSLSVLKQGILVRQGVNSNACWYLKMMREDVNLALYIEVKVTKFRDVPL